MILITKCTYEQCEKHDNCMRYLANGVEINFKAICGKDYSYQWFWRKDIEAPVKVDEGEDK